MIAADVDKFYRKVIKDMIVSLSKNEFLLKQLEQNNIFLHHIEQKMLEKLQDSHSLFRRLTLSYNEIEKEMLSRYVSVDDIVYNERKIRLNSHSRSVVPRQSHASEQIADDLESYRPSSVSEQSDKVKQEQQIHNLHEQEDHSNRLKRNRNPNSDISFDDLSEMDVEHADTLKRLREQAKIHILGTYDYKSKKHHFKSDKTRITLENVFIKAQGVAKQIFLPKLNCVSRKKVHL